METPETENLELQRINITRLYDRAAPVYNERYEGEADYQIPGLLKDIYKENGIESGLILDVGCGTGRIIDHLGDSFTYKGIDISPAMAIESNKKGLGVEVGPVEDIIRRFPDKSVDHITSLSTIYFIKDFAGLMKEFERVARKSIFISLENFDNETIESMKNLGINIYNHNSSVVDDPKEVKKNVYLWNKPENKEKVYGDVVFKNI